MQESLKKYHVHILRGVARMNDKMYITIEGIENRAELHCHTKMSEDNV